MAVRRSPGLLGPHPAVSVDTPGVDALTVTAFPERSVPALGLEFGAPFPPLTELDLATADRSKPISRLPLCL
ncbi:MAG: hypothetical protein GY720_08905 [bacterium]|nr:hypothetical protein [Actinomycetes bacterium]MCP3974597.1 hypothetical protein [bacterium]